MSSADIDAFCQILSAATCVAILSGAGLSAASGIQTYRGVDGQWNTTDPMTVASLKAFQEDPSRVWRYYLPKRDQCMNAKPNAAHTALASLSIPSIRARLLPSLSDSSKAPLHVTQNFDGLCRRALDAALDANPEVESRDEVHERLVEMHGSCRRTVCTQCKAVRYTDDPLLNEYGTEQDPIPVDSLPRCGGPEWRGSNRHGRCGGPLRPGVVWFGEIPEHQGEIVRNMTKVDVLIVVGTSSLVFPAAGYTETVRRNGGFVAVFNLGKSNCDDKADFTFYGPCEETVPHLLGRLSEVNS